MKLPFTEIGKNVKGSGMEVEWHIGKSIWDTSHLLVSMSTLSREWDSKYIWSSGWKSRAGGITLGVITL